MEHELSELAEQVLQAADEAGLSLASAESCTGGLVATLFTGVEGLSSAFCCGLVTYSEHAKSAVLDIPADRIERFGAVSEEIARAMARQARKVSGADLAVAVTGYTGAAGPHENGLVHIATFDGAREAHAEFHFGDVSRDEGRRLAASEALHALLRAIPAGRR
jgi:nicotinamide-nucleotide amidase